MTCVVPVWEVAVLIIVAAICISLIVYVVVCIVTKCRDKVEDDEFEVNEDDFVITEEQLLRDGE